MQKIIFSCILTIAVCIYSSIAVAKLEYIELKYQQPEEMLQAIEPFLDKNSTIKVYGNGFIIQFDEKSKNNIADLKNLIKQLDKKLVQFAIYVSRNPPNKNRRTITTKRMKNSENKIKKILVQERHLAKIASDEAILYPSGWKYIDQGVSTSKIFYGGQYIQYDDLETGLYLLAKKIADEQIELEVTDISSHQLERRKFKTNITQTKIIVTLGDWTAILKKDEPGGTRRYSTDFNNTQNRDIWIKVELN